MPKSVKLKISPAQGLLLLIDFYKNDEKKLNNLKKYYLSGPENSEETSEIKELLSDKCLSDYIISYSFQTIDQDASRRYFETHLAYQSLKHSLADLKLENISSYYKKLEDLLPQGNHYLLEDVMKGLYFDSDNYLDKEYADYIKKLNKGTIFHDLSGVDRAKIKYLVKISFLGVLCARHAKYLPIDIYGTGDFSSFSRGKYSRPRQETTRSSHLGLMKGRMALPSDDIARANN